MSQKTNATLDVLKFLCAILVVASHCLPIFHNDSLNLYYGQWFFRFCIPLFFISSGYYFFQMDAHKRNRYIKRILFLYVAASLLYAPFLLKPFFDKAFLKGLLQLLLGYSHLWYLSALLFSLYFLNLLEQKSNFFQRSGCFPTISGILLLIGAFLGIYCQLIDIPIINTIGNQATKYGLVRHSVFFASPLILIGKHIGESKEILRQSVLKLTFLLLLSVVVSFTEFSVLIAALGVDILCDLTLFNWIPAVFLFILTFKIQITSKTYQTRILRKTADCIYVIHPWVIIILRKLHIENILGFICTSFISILLSLGIVHRHKIFHKVFHQDKN